MLAPHWLQHFCNPFPPCRCPKNRTVSTYLDIIKFLRPAFAITEQVPSRLRVRPSALHPQSLSLHPQHYIINSKSFHH